MGACARNMQSDSAEIKPAQCCIKLVFHLTYKESTQYMKTQIVSVAFRHTRQLPELHQYETGFWDTI